MFPRLPIASLSHAVSFQVGPIGQMDLIHSFETSYWHTGMDRDSTPTGRGVYREREGATRA